MRLIEKTTCATQSIVDSENYSYCHHYNCNPTYNVQPSECYNSLAFHFLCISKLFISRSQPKPHNKEDTPCQFPEEKQKVRALGLSKYKNPSSKEDNNLLPSAFSHRELCHGQYHGGHKYTNPKQKGA